MDNFLVMWRLSVDRALGGGGGGLGGNKGGVRCNIRLSAEHLVK